MFYPKPRARGVDVNIAKFMPYNPGGYLSGGDGGGAAVTLSIESKLIIAFRSEQFRR